MDGFERNMLMRQRGMGSLYKQKSSRIWWMKFYVNGRPRRESTHKRDWSEAANVLKLRLAEIAVNGDAASSTLTIRQLVQMKLRSNQVRGLKDLHNPAARWKLHLEPFFGNVKVKDYASNLTLQYIEKRKGEGASGSSIDKEIQVIRGAFSYGMKITPPLVRFMPHFPMTGEDDVRQVFVETEGDKKELREAAAKEGPYMLGLVEIGLTYGWRRGSLLSMKVKNVNLLRETLYCSVSKNGDPNTVPLLASLRAALVPCMRGKRPDDWLFSHADGSPVRGYRKAWARVLRSAGLNPELHFHDLRRTARVAMADRNMDERWAMDLMGHRTRSCSERYNIVNMETRRRAAAMLEQPVAIQESAPKGKDSSQRSQRHGQTEGRIASGRQDRNGHSSGILNMPKTMAAGSEVQ